MGEVAYESEMEGGESEGGEGEESFELLGEVPEFDQIGGDVFREPKCLAVVVLEC